MNIFSGLNFSFTVYSDFFSEFETMFQVALDVLRCCVGDLR